MFLVSRGVEYIEGEEDKEGQEDVEGGEDDQLHPVRPVEPAQVEI